MNSQLVVIHRRRDAQTEDIPFGAEVFAQNEMPHVLWETCVRRIAVGFEDHKLTVDASDADEVFRGPEARQFLLEVVCGLHSPIRGETEVHGQFKELLEKISQEHDLYKPLFAIHLDARRVRDSHLRGLGSQSYGSLARRKMRGMHEVHVVGSGALTRDILPWISKLEAAIFVYARDVEKAYEKLKSQLERMETVRLLPLSDRMQVVSGGPVGVLIAAPLESRSLQHFLAPGFSHVGPVLDYRSESSVDPLPMASHYLSLQDIFREIESTKQKVESEVERAKQLIQTLSL